MNFEESKVKRDERGRFAKKNSQKEKELEKKYNDDLPPLKQKRTLTQKEFAIWYQKIGEIKRGGYVDTMSNGNKLIPIGNKIAVTTGSYENPKLKQVAEFSSEEEMFSWLEKFGEIK